MLARFACGEWTAWVQADGKLAKELNCEKG